MHDVYKIGSDNIRDRVLLVEHYLNNVFSIVSPEHQSPHPLVYAILLLLQKPTVIAFFRHSEKKRRPKLISISYDNSITRANIRKEIVKALRRKTKSKKQYFQKSNSIKFNPVFDGKESKLPYYMIFFEISQEGFESLNLNWVDQNNPNWTLIENIFDRLFNSTFSDNFLAWLGKIISDWKVAKTKKETRKEVDPLSNLKHEERIFRIINDVIENIYTGFSGSKILGTEISNIRNCFFVGKFHNISGIRPVINENVGKNTIGHNFGYRFFITSDQKRDIGNLLSKLYPEQDLDRFFGAITKPIRKKISILDESFTTGNPNFVRLNEISPDNYLDGSSGRDQSGVHLHKAEVEAMKMRRRMYALAHHGARMNSFHEPEWRNVSLNIFPFHFVGAPYFAVCRVDETSNENELDSDPVHEKWMNNLIFYTEFVSSFAKKFRSRLRAAILEDVRTLTIELIGDLDISKQKSQKTVASKLNSYFQELSCMTPLSEFNVNFENLEPKVSSASNIRYRFNIEKSDNSYLEQIASRISSAAAHSLKTHIFSHYRPLVKVIENNADAIRKASMIIFIGSNDSKQHVPEYAHAMEIFAFNREEGAKIEIQSIRDFIQRISKLEIKKYGPNVLHYPTHKSLILKKSINSARSFERVFGTPTNDKLTPLLKGLTVYIHVDSGLTNCLYHHLEKHEHLDSMVTKFKLADKDGQIDR